MINKMYGNQDAEQLTAKPQYKFKQLEERYPAFLKKKTTNLGSLKLKDLRNNHNLS